MGKAARRWSLFFFNDTATTEIYTLSLHDALPISRPLPEPLRPRAQLLRRVRGRPALHRAAARGHRQRVHAGQVRGLHRSEEHTSELQSRQYLVCRLLLEKKNGDLSTCRAVMAGLY